MRKNRTYTQERKIRLARLGRRMREAVKKEFEANRLQNAVLYGKTPRQMLEDWDNGRDYE